MVLAAVHDKVAGGEDQIVPEMLLVLSVVNVYQWMVQDVSLSKDSLPTIVVKKIAEDIWSRRGSSWRLALCNPLDHPFRLDESSFSNRLYFCHSR